MLFLTSIGASASQTSALTTSVERQNVYTNLCATELGTTGHLITVKVMMPVIIKSNVPSPLPPHLADARAICQMIIRKDARLSPDTAVL